MSNDQVKQEAPERIYLHNPWNVEQSPCGCDGDIAYVPESLIATVRREAFKEARRKVYMISGSNNVDPSVRKGFAAGVNAAIEVIAALESSANSEPDEPRAHILKELG